LADQVIIEVSARSLKEPYTAVTFLLHEEFQKPVEKMKHERKSRHFHDLDKIMDTSFDSRNYTQLMARMKELLNRFRQVTFIPKEGGATEASQ
jgi:hypothetical protein